jgi:hypothetical protein
MLNNVKHALVFIQNFIFEQKRYERKITYFFIDLFRI